MNAQTAQESRKTTALREQMIDLMLVKNFSPKTQKSYLYGVTHFANYYHKSPTLLGENDVQQYLVHLIKERKLSANSCRLQLQGIRFLYAHVLHRPIKPGAVHYPKRPNRIPDLLTPEEALTIVCQPENMKHKCELMLCYACGLRVSEVVHLRVKDIDGARHQIKIEQGKGMKDRFVPLPDELLNELRKYWQIYRSSHFLFYCGENRNRALTTSTVQRLYKRAKTSAKVTKAGGIHALRHAFATHQLEAGVPIYFLQRWLGHADIQTTMRYIHWVPSYQNGDAQFANLMCRSVS